MFFNESLNRHNPCFSCHMIFLTELWTDLITRLLNERVAISFQVRAPWVKHFYYVDYDTYILPGFDLLTLGGTRQFDSYSSEVCRHDAAAIWERCTQVLPSLRNGEVCFHLDRVKTLFFPSYWIRHGWKGILCRIIVFPHNSIFGHREFWFHCLRYTILINSVLYTRKG